MTEALMNSAEDNEELGAVVVDGNKVATPGSNSDIISKIPGPESPLIFKIVPQKKPTGELLGYYPVTMHPHLVGDRDPKNSKNFRSHLCQKSSGQSECAECDKYYEIYNAMKALEKDGKKGNPEYLRLESQSKVLEPSTKGWLLVVLPDNPRVKAIRVAKAVLNELFGKKETKFKPAIPSLITQMIADGNDPYNLRSNVGWISLSKVGEKMGTKYTVVAATKKEEVDVRGKKTIVDVPFEAAVHANILKLKRADLPNPAKLEEKNAWKKEDSQFMAKNFRAPDHILSAAANGGNSNNDEGEDDDPLSAQGAGTLSDLPVADALPSSPAAVNSTVDMDAVDNML